MESNAEIRRLTDVMPASGRMSIKIISKPQQSKVIDTIFPLPWNTDRLIYINFDLWRRLTRQQRDLLFLRMTSWVMGVKWFEPELYQGVVLAGILGSLVEVTQGDLVGVVVGGGLTALAATRIWNNNRSQESELSADAAAIKIALRRGYSEVEAAQHLLSGIESLAKIEGRSGLSFIELIRCQNLRAIAGFSAVGIPE